jgi:hypothetical protein
MPSGVDLDTLEIIVDGVEEQDFDPTTDCTLQADGVTYHCEYEMQNINESKTHKAIIRVRDRVCNPARHRKQWTNWVNITVDTEYDVLSVCCPECRDQCSGWGVPDFLTCFLGCSCDGKPSETEVVVRLIPPEEECLLPGGYYIPDGTLVDMSMSTGGFYSPWVDLPTVHGMVMAKTMCSEHAGVSTVTASVDGFMGSADISYIACHVTGVWVVASPSSVVADGVSNASLTLQLVDDYGNPIAKAGTNITLSSDKGVVSPVVVTTDQFGRATAVLTSDTVPGVAVVSAEIEGSHLVDSTTVEFTEVPVAPFDDKLVLEAGEWSLVSTPLALNESNASVVFGDDFVLLYDNAGDSWIFPPETIDPTYGYWVYSSDNETVDLVYKTYAFPPVPPVTALGAGWNMIGHTTRQEMSVRDALYSIDGKYAYVLRYTGSGWDLYVAGADNSGDGRFEVMEPGVGYWVFMNQPGNYAALSV